ncbi:MAG: 5-formyltetrahydrofolate cyclo-ligase family-domain-containing protein [Monoraphidium minutum]|nr:MAG: 5-formyltetrahydrofolate cyclo-ligase family-domain-containing protein [Monoraphidium minutum]
MAAAAAAGAGGAPGFDTETYDAERLKLDEQARSKMIRKAELDLSAPPGSKEGAWKWEMRKAMWDFMEGNNIARQPRPVHHRIPNFVDADKAAERLAELPEFKTAKLVKVNPDTPSKPVRVLTLAAGKQLLSPQPRLRTGFFSVLDAGSFPPDALREAVTSAGAAKYGRPLGLEETRGLKVDLLVVGSSCVSPNGARLGKGEGFAEVEFGILALLGAVGPDTPVVTVVHDCQVLEGEGAVPADKMLEHDVPVDIIVTPTRVIRCTHPPGTKKPPGILPEKLASIRVLQQLKERIEQETGAKLPSGG